MPTLVLNAYSKAYPFITNRIQASVFLQTDLLAPIATIIDNVAGHPARIWSFPGLPRNNYAFSLDEIDGGGLPVNNLALFDVVPGQLDGMLVRDDEQIEVDVTTGFDAGLNTVTFDGTGGKPNYIGWEIVPSELDGRGILKEGLDYSWDKLTGVYTLLQAGDVLQAHVYYNIHFNPITNPAGNSYPTITDFEINLITADTTLDTSYFGKKLIVEPAGVYVEVELPDITTVPQGRRMMVEVYSTSPCCVKFIPFGADVINWLIGNLYALPNESFSIYAYSRAGTKEWRICEADGNFKTVGNSVGADQIQVDVYNMQLMDGSIKLKTQYARIYNEIVLQLPVTQRVNYDDWATGNNSRFFSLANSANPANADKFHFPDRRNLFERNNNAGKTGDYFADKMKIFWPGGMAAPSIVDVNGTNTEIGVDNGAGCPDIKTQRLIDTSLFGTENFPKHHLINRYILI